MLKKRRAHNKTRGRSDLPVQGIFIRIKHFEQLFVQKPIEDEIDEEEDDEEEDDLEESDDNCSDSGDEVFSSDLEDDDCSDSDEENETYGKFYLSHAKTL